MPHPGLQMLRGRIGQAVKSHVILARDKNRRMTWTQFFDLEKMPLEQRPPHSELRRSPLSDDGYAVVSGMISEDDGKTWSERFTVADDRDAAVNTMSPCLTRMQDGRILLAYSWRNGSNHRDNYGPCAKRVRNCIPGKTISHQ